MNKFNMRSLLYIVVMGSALACGSNAPDAFEPGETQDAMTTFDASPSLDSQASTDTTSDNADSMIADTTATADTTVADSGSPADTGGVADSGSPVWDTGNASDSSGGMDAGSPDGGGTSANSCAGRCGEYSGGASCQCDSACESFDDCCTDFQKLCGCTVDADCAKLNSACDSFTCSVGLCTKSLNPAGKCDDDNACTQDSCDPATGNCVYVNAMDGSSCAAADCLTQQTCTAGKCGGGINKTDGSFCSDGNTCTLSDSCSAGVCAPGTAKDCNDKNTCTKDSCDPKTGCDFTPSAAEGTKCDDGTTCTKDTKCTKAGACKGVVLPVKTVCDDGDVCTTDDNCSSFGTCSGKSKSCNDDNSCTTDSCDKNSGNCKNEVKTDGSFCSDGSTCTTGDTCTAGQCVGKPLPDSTPCSDGNICTSGDLCFGGLCDGQPDATATGKACSDGSYCTTKDICDGAGVCAGTPDTAVCDDGNGCTIDSCTSQPGSFQPICDHKPVAANQPCDDGDLCTSATKCNATSQCVGGTSVCKDQFSDDIDCNSTKWTFAPAAAGQSPGWAADGTPSTPAAHTGKCSLNYNNGADYDLKDSLGQSAKNAGVVTLGTAVDLPAATTSVLSFWSYHGVEQSQSYDLRTVEVSSDNFVSGGDMKVWTLNNTAPNTVSQWIKLSLPLDGFEGKKINLRFAFDTKDAVSNSGPGWFVDDVKIRSVK